MSEQEKRDAELPAACRSAGAREACLAALQREEEELLRPLVARLEATEEAGRTQAILDEIVAIQRAFARKRQAAERSM